MFLCFHVTKLHESIRFHVFSPFNAHFPPQNDVMVNGPLCTVHAEKFNICMAASFPR